MTRLIRQDSGEEEEIKEKDWRSSEAFKTKDYFWTGETLFDIIPASVPTAQTPSRFKQIRRCLTRRVLNHQIKFAEFGSTKTTIVEPDSGEVPPAVVLPDPVSDFWEHKGVTWIRHHRVPRSRLFVPESEPRGPPLQRLLPRRTTMFKSATDPRWRISRFEKIRGAPVMIPKIDSI